MKKKISREDATQGRKALVKPGNFVSSWFNKISHGGAKSYPALF